MKSKLQIWYQNTTSRNIVLDELGMTIKKEATVNLLTYNPSLTVERIRKSEANGILYTCVKSGKLLPVDGPIVKEKNITRFVESKEPIYSRNYSVVNIDPDEKDFVDQLEKEFLSDMPHNDSEQVAANEKFLKKFDLDGFIDPLADQPDE